MNKMRMFFYQFVFCFIMTLVMGITAARLHPHGIFGMFTTCACGFAFAAVFNYVVFLAKMN